MSTQPSFQFNPSADAVSGFEDLAGHKAAGDDASNLLMVFMLRGNHTAWKQTVAYFHVSHSIEPKVLKSMVTTILTEIHGTGIEVSYYWQMKKFKIIL